MNNPRLSVEYGRDGVITVDYRDWLQGSILRTGAYEPEVWAALTSRAQDNEVFWDIGAHIGKVENGYFADLVILNSNPGDDISHASDIHTVIKNGVLYPADSILR